MIVMIPGRYKKRHANIEIWEPRYHDRRVLVATRKIANKNYIKILKGAFAGEYFISEIAARSYPIESNGAINCYAIPLSQLERR